MINSGIHLGDRSLTLQIHAKDSTLNPKSKEFPFIFMYISLNELLKYMASLYIDKIRKNLHTNISFLINTKELKVDLNSNSFIIN